MPVPITEMENLHYLEWLVLNDDRFMGTIEAAMRGIAVEVYAEPPETHGHDQRAQVALNIVLSDIGTGEAARFRNIFATVVIQDEGLRGQFFDTSDPDNTSIPLEDRIKPWLMDAEWLGNVIRAVWNVAAGISEEPEPEESEE